MNTPVLPFTVVKGGKRRRRGAAVPAHILDFAKKLQWLKSADPELYGGMWRIVEMRHREMRTPREN